MVISSTRLCSLALWGTEYCHYAGLLLLHAALRAETHLPFAGASVAFLPFARVRYVERGFPCVSSPFLATSQGTCLETGKSSSRDCELRFLFYSLRNLKPTGKSTVYRVACFFLFFFTHSPHASSVDSHYTTHRIRTTSR